MIDDSERAAFLRTIIDAPADDLPRLVFADWLDEQGESDRAEFIRVQCELDNPGVRAFARQYQTGDDYKSTVEMIARERELLRLNWRKWVPNYADWMKPGATFDDHAVFRRGFVSEIRCTLAAFVGEETVVEVIESEVLPLHVGLDMRTELVGGIAQELFQNHPIERVVLSNREPADRTRANERWYWFRAGPSLRTDHDFHSLPSELFVFLVGAERSTIGLPYLSREDAIEALSAACVAYGRAYARSYEPGKIVARPIQNRREGERQEQSVHVVTPAETPRPNTPHCSPGTPTRSAPPR